MSNKIITIKNEYRERLISILHVGIDFFSYSPVFSQKFSDNYMIIMTRTQCFTAKFVCKLGIGSQRGARIITPLFQYIWFSFLCIFFLIFATREIFSVKSKFHENLSFWGERNWVKEIFLKTLSLLLSYILWVCFVLHFKKPNLFRQLKHSSFKRVYR